MSSTSKQRLVSILEKRSHAGTYIYIFIWLLIALSIDYHREFPTFFWLTSTLLALMGAIRFSSALYSKRLRRWNAKAWMALFLFNALAPSLILGSLLALSVSLPKYEALFTYLLLSIFALISGTTILYAPHFRLAGAFILLLTLPAMLCILLLPTNHDLEGAMLALYTSYMFLQLSVLNKEFKIRAQQQEELENLSKLDDLTGIYNRRHFEEMLTFYWATNRRQQQPLGLVLVDIDHFKQVNDNFGHPTGDEVIRQVAQAVKNNFRRETDVVARIGGEEFAALIPQPEPGFIEAQTEHLCQEIANKIIMLEEDQLQVTVSIGAVATIPQQQWSPRKFYRQADICLYKAKHQGRNRVIYSDTISQ